jgi:predicted transcriptional regulator/transcriptional regulator with XRE-family HTH domain
MTRTYVGARIRRLRDELGLQQNVLADQLGISASYLNQLERDQRPLTAPVLLKLIDTFGDRVVFLSEVDQVRLAGELQEVALDLDGTLTKAEITHLVSSQPDLGAVLVSIHRRYRDTADQLAALTDSVGARESLSAPTFMPYDMVRDFFYDNHNYFGALDEAAEALAQSAGLRPGAADDGLVAHLAARHGVNVAVPYDEPSTPDTAGDYRHYDPQRRALTLSGRLTAGQRAYQLATQIAFLEHSELLDELTSSPILSTPDAVALARIGLANHFAGAVLMPYRQFLDAAEANRYDIELLAARFGVSFETTCHRLSSLQRPGARGVPFLFVRVDQAGNISKRQSAADFHFSRIGGSCPLWVIHDTFSAPGRILTQLTEMPDGRRHFTIARTTEERRGGWRSPTRRFAIGLGCDIRYAERLVYADGLDLHSPQAFTPIGAGCKVCDRPHCPQRAFPPIGRPLAIDEHRSYEPYPDA